MDQTILEQCQERIGYCFSDPSLLSLALTHSSVAPTRGQSNERLEFLGDAVLGLTVCHELYNRYRELMEGELTKIKSAVVSRQTCARLAEKAGISELVFIGKGMPSFSSGKLPPSVLAAGFEAIIGAVYIDGGLEEAQRFILEHIEDYIKDAFANEHQRNFKSMLQQHAQRNWSITPEYQLLDEKGPDHSKCFEIAVAIQGRQFPSAWGQSKKQAEQSAARRALTELGLLQEDTEGEDAPE